MSGLRLLGAAAVLAAIPYCAAGGEPPEHHITMRKFNVSYRAAGQLADIERVDLWYTTDGGRTWRFFGSDKDKRSPVGFQASREGTYGFKVVALNAAGLSDPKPTRGTKPDMVIVVDTSAPKVVYTGPAGDVVGPRQEVEVTYTVSDEHLGDSPITLEYSVDRGAAWNELAAGIRNTGAVKVEIPGKHGDEVLLRVTAADKAGNSSSAKSARAMTVDGKPPVVSITGPKSASGNQITVTYRAQDVGRADVAEVKLYSSVDGGRTWKLAGSDRDLDGRMPFEVTKPASYGFHVVAVDKAGNASQAPAAGARPMHVVVMDTSKPVVAVLAMSGGAVAGGRRQQILWKASDDNMASLPITISYSADGGKDWKVIAKKLPNTGKYLWTVPAINSRDCMVRIEAVDLFGNKAAAVSEAPFVVTTQAPSTTAYFDPAAQEAVELPVADVPERPVAVPVEKPVERPVEVPVEFPVERPAGPRVPRAKLDEATKLIDARRYTDAVALLSRELGRAPKSSAALALRGRAYLGDDKTAAAMEDLRRAIELDRNSREAWLQLGVGHFRQAKSAHKAKDVKGARAAYAAAVNAYESAVKIAIIEGGEGSDVEYYYCGMAYYQLFVLDGSTGKNGDLALQRLKQAMAVGGSDSSMGGTCWYLAKIHEARGENELAKEHWKKTANYFSPGNPFHKKAMEYYRRLGGE